MITSVGRWVLLAAAFLLASGGYLLRWIAEAVDDLEAQ